MHGETKFGTLRYFAILLNNFGLLLRARFLFYRLIIYV